MPKKKKKRKSKKKVKKISKKLKKISKRKIKKSRKKNRRMRSKNRSKVSLEKIYKTKSEWLKHALINKSMYEKKYKESLRNNNDFWAREGKRISWIKPYTKIKDVTYSKTDVSIKWFYD